MYAWISRPWKRKTSRKDLGSFFPWPRCLPATSSTGHTSADNVHDLDSPSLPETTLHFFLSSPPLYANRSRNFSPLLICVCATWWPWWNYYSSKFSKSSSLKRIQKMNEFFFFKNASSSAITIRSFFKRRFSYFIRRDFYRYIEVMRDSQIN